MSAVRPTSTWLKAPLAVAVMAVVVIGCSSSPHKAKELDTRMDKSEKVSGDTKVGVKDDKMVVQRKVRMNEELRLLQNEVYGLEDKVYGNRKYGSQGLYGNLKTCRRKLTSRKFGGDGKLRWTEPIDRVTDKEERFDIGLDERGKLVGVKEEFLLDRIARFRDYKRVLMKREDEYKEKLEICDAALESRKYDMKKEAKAN